MSISFDQYRHAINEAVERLGALPDPTPEEVAAIVELQAILDALPVESEDS